MSHEVVVNVVTPPPINLGYATPSSITLGYAQGGAVGPQGPQGPAGPPSTTIDVGKVTTLAAGSNATVTATSSNSGANLTLAFGLPVGATGPQGASGQNGITPTITASATTLAAGSSATVTATPSNGGANVALAFGIPRGDPGEGGGSSNLSLSDGTPSALGTASPGTSSLASRADHTHQLPVISYANLSGVPTNFPSNIASVTGLQAALDGKQAAGNYLTSAVTALNNLTGSLTLVAGANLSLTSNSSAITVSLDDNAVIDGGNYVGEIVYPYAINITQQPSNQTASGGNATFSATGVVTTNGTPAGIAPSYQWQRLDSEAFSWSQRAMPADASWYAVTYGGGQFVAVAHSGTAAATSPDGVAWTQRTLPASALWYGVAYGNGVFVATSGGSSNIAATSPDGVTWTQRTLPATANWRRVIFANGVFVAVAYGSAVAATSPDGVTWTQRTLPAVAGWDSLAYGNGVFVTLGYNQTIAASSPDGVTWTQRTLPDAVEWSDVAFGNGVFVAVSSSVSGAVAATSPDGITWTQQSLPMRSAAITFGNGLFVATGNTGNTYAATQDGVTWTTGTLPSSQSRTDAAYGAGVFAVVGIGASAVTSPAGSAWTNVGNLGSSGSLTLTGLTNAADNGDQYRAVVSAVGAAPVTSNAATLTVS